MMCDVRSPRGRYRPTYQGTNMLYNATIYREWRMTLRGRKEKSSIDRQIDIGMVFPTVDVLLFVAKKSPR